MVSSLAFPVCGVPSLTAPVCVVLSLTFAVCAVLSLAFSVCVVSSLAFRICGVPSLTVPVCGVLSLTFAVCAVWSLAFSVCAVWSLNSAVCGITRLTFAVCGITRLTGAVGRNASLLIVGCLLCFGSGARTLLWCSVNIFGGGAGARLRWMVGRLGRLGCVSVWACAWWACVGARTCVGRGDELFRCWGGSVGMAELWRCVGRGDAGEWASAGAW
jgi:hypothetical protein